jgi:PAS domain S-box-containing protein
MIRVLYVDDEESLLELARHFLGNSKDISLITSLNAREGLDHMRSGNVDVVVSDYSMPEIDGLAFLKELRRSGNDIPFILFTGKGREEVAIQALNEGADFYLQKGGEPRSLFVELTHKIRHASEKRSSGLALKESETRLRRAEEKAKFGHWELHLNDMNMTASPGAMMIYGLSGGKWAHEEVREVLLPMFREKLDKALEDLIVHGIAYNVEFKIRRKEDGRIVDVISQAEYDKDRNIVFGVLQDVSDRVKVENELKKKNEELNSSYEQIGLSEEELRQSLEDLIENQKELSESELRFRRVFETIPIGVWLADKDGTLLAGNPAGQDIWEAEPHVGQEVSSRRGGYRQGSRSCRTIGRWVMR